MWIVVQNLKKEKQFMCLTNKGFNSFGLNFIYERKYDVDLQQV